jgi:cytochrome oxidase Cu insertion factor (SCO1/SenC/PrrC family)
VARDISHLEPAERDPVRLRRTGWPIGVIMVAGGVLVMAAYLLKLRADAKDDRPHIVGRLIMATFGGRDQHGNIFATSMLEDKITLIAPLSGRNEARMAESLRVMKMVAERFPEDEQLRFVGITVDPENDGPAQLQAMLDDLGVGDDARWFFVQAEEKNAVGYLRHKLRLETSETIRLEGQEVKRFRSAIALIDPNLHLLEPQYDFNLAREVEEEARQVLQDDPERAERLDAKAHTDDVKRAEERLFRSLEYVRKGDLKEGKKK